MRIFLLLLIVSLSNFGSCLANYPSDYIEFMKLPNNVREQEFKSLSLEKQVEYFEYCAGATTCDDFYFVIIPSRGRAAVPYLLNRVEMSPDSRKYAISILLEEMNEKFVKLDDRETVERLNGTLNSMKDPVWKEMTEKNLSKILNAQ